MGFHFINLYWPLRPRLLSQILDAEYMVTLLNAFCRVRLGLAGINFAQITQHVREDTTGIT